MSEKPGTPPDRAAGELHTVERLEKESTNLARDRASLANYTVKLSLDRTTLAWIRTTLTMSSFGFSMVAFFRALREAHAQSVGAVRMHEGAIKMGMAFLVLAIIATVLAAVSHWRTLSRLRQGGIPVLTHWPLSITVAVLLAGIGLAGFFYLLM